LLKKKHRRLFRLPKTARNIESITSEEWRQVKTPYQEEKATKHAINGQARGNVREYKREWPKEQKVAPGATWVKPKVVPGHGTA